MNTSSVAASRSLFDIALALLLALTLAACGGGLGGAVAPSIGTQPASATLVEGQSATFSVAANGSAPLTYQWRRDGTDIAGANAASYSIASAALGDSGAQYSVLVGNAAGSIASDAATLTVNPAVAPSITQQPQPLSVVAGGSATFSVVATGSEPLAYQWRRDGADIPGAVAASYTLPASAVSDDGALFSVVVSNTHATQATSENAKLGVTEQCVMPAITTAPAGMSVVAPASASFSVVASGSAPLNYQWRRGGVPIAGATASAYTTPSTAAADNGALFSVVVANACGTATSGNATLTVGADPVAPTITDQPDDLTVVAGNGATFSVAADGTPPLAYQWRRNGAAIAGASAASYTIAATAPADSGAKYSVVVSNAHPTPAISADATLTVTPVIDPPVITDGPDAISVAEGQTATFSVVATGSAPLQYQWRRNGVPIAGANAASYTTGATLPADNGAKFSVVVGNAHADAATSSEATLTVTAPVWAGVREDGAPRPSRDTAYAVATDGAGNVVIAGKSDGSLPGANDRSLPDPFVAKYSKGGQLLWLKSVLDVRTALGTTDTAWGVATDGAGNIYVAGDTVDTLPGEDKAGGRDAFIAKFDGNGNRLWAHLLGSTADDTARGIAVDANGNAFIVGSSNGGQLPLQAPRQSVDFFIAKYDTNGVRQWVRQDGSAGWDYAHGVAVDATGNAYMTGTVEGNFDASSNPGVGYDAFVAKYGGNGNRIWFSRLASKGPDEARAVAVSRDGGTVYLTGYTNGDFDLPGFPAQTIFCCGTPDAFIARLDGSGALQWAHNLSSLTLSGPRHFDDRAFGIATDATGSAAFIAGATNGVMPDEASKGAYDMFVARFEGHGARTWIRQFGADVPSNSSGTDNQWDHAFAIAMDPAGDLFVAGDSIGSWPGGSPGGDTDRTDWIVMKLKAADGSAY